MEQSPLSQQARPDSFQPKVVALYEELFREVHQDQPQGFWEELFLLKPDFTALRRILDALSPDEALLHQVSTQQFFSNAILTFKKGKSPSDEIALDTLSAFLENVLNKRYTSPNSDIITVLADLHEVDTVLTDFVDSLNTTIRNGRTLQVRQKAVQAALATVSGSYRTGLVSYFIAKDLFPSLMKLVQEADDSVQLKETFTLLTLLVNYNKFEFQNPYQHRLADFINESAIRKAVAGMGAAFVKARDQYVAVQNDQVEGWSLGGTLSYFGLGSRASASAAKAVILTADEQKAAFALLPPPEAAIILSTYDFANANKLFCLRFVTASETPKSEPSSLDHFLSLTSYMVQHAHRTTRGAVYTCMSMLILRVLLEDASVAKILCDVDNKTAVRLCRQRQPFLPVVRGRRPPVCFILDIIVDGITHNLQRRLDVELYHLFFTILVRILAYLSRSRTRLVYHWPTLWLSLLSTARFLSTYHASLSPLAGIAALARTLTQLLALSVARAEFFVDGGGARNAYDDLLYKVFEAGQALRGLRTAFAHADDPDPAADLLVGVAQHFEGFMDAGVEGVVARGYETLRVSTAVAEEAEMWEVFREQEVRGLLKRGGRAGVEDARALVLAPLGLLG